MDDLLPLKNNWPTLAEDVRLYFEREPDTAFDAYETTGLLPFEKTETAANGNVIRCGIEMDALGRRVACHFRRRHPGDSTDRGSPIPKTVRLAAAEVLHVYRPLDARQLRGLPHVALVMVRLFLLDQYDDAEIDRKKTAAMFAGFITKTAPEEQKLGEVEAAGDGIGTASLEPGTL